MSGVQPDDARLVQLAREAAKNSMCPFSGFSVGAALLTKEGQVFLGCNIENWSLSMSSCAEQVVMLKALSEGAREFSRIAVWADTENHVTPCGKCRQLLIEFAPDIEVIMANGRGEFIKRPISELLPMAFRHKIG